ncbi:unnamed protein product, partial [Bodo saltans]
DSSQ